ncbi:MAG TPA: TorF family putative porin [Phenylobacterium sp.]|uniref:TorF family putative porin n=1 Tax=Phenylobacterium sp. TaxID=1871053 RepID=UPI002B470297|nr:TorF family putative porin [Phenylobacterium sp.]HKR86583.1 TorF family putative porin [Phenylobacterium sp.]
MTPQHKKTRAPAFARRSGFGGPALAILTAVLAVGAANSAAAQVRAAAEVATSARFRGRAVSQNQPVAGLDLSYDAASGVYAGVSGAVAATSHDGLQGLTLREYLGYARRLDAGPTVDFGFTHATYSEYYGGRGAPQYSEVYAGLTTRRLTTRLSYSPSYFGSQIRTLYGEVESAVQPARNWRLSAHGGVLARVGGGQPPPGYRTLQYDWRVGLATALRSFEVELAWSGAGPDAAYGSRSGVVLALRRDF